MRTGAERSNFEESQTSIDLARVRDDGLRDPHLAVIVVEKRTVLVDRRGADDGDIHLELADEIDRRLADHAAVVGRTTPPAITTSICG